MTHGTSAHGESLSRGWADAGQDQADVLSRWRQAALGWLPDPMQVAGEAAPIQLLSASVVVGLVLGATLTATWQALADAGSDGPVAAQLALLIAVGAVAALIALRPRDPAPPSVVPQDLDASSQPSQLLAQMHHELRTPLNAMIGFSEVMLHELHGPLGHARYQEYAAQISESGGRLLKASEDALAVAATMSALVADRRALHRERLPAAALLQGAYAALGVSPHDARLRVEGGESVEIECDWPTTSQALQHVLAEAVVRTPRGGAIIAGMRRVCGQSYIEIETEPSQPGRDHQPAARDNPPVDADIATCDGVRLLLARSLLEMQGAALSLCSGPRAGAWSARIVFSCGRPALQARDAAA